MTQEELLEMNSSAFFAVSEIARILRLAIQRGQRFTVNVSAGQMPDGQSADGSFQAHVCVEPLKPETSA